MIEAIREVGRYAIKEAGENIEEPLGILIDDPESNRKHPTYKNILLIKVNDNYEYEGIDIVEYSSQKLNLYLYRQGSKNGPDVTPTSRITRVESDGSKKTTFEIKMLSWFEKYKTRDDFLFRLKECLRKKSKEIQDDLKEKYKIIKKGEKAILTLKINGKYIGDYKIFKDILLEEAKKNFYSKYEKISKSDNQICSVCNKKESEIYGFVDTYKFYTVDKPGFVTGGFQQKYAWKNYPVCFNCALILEAGKKYLGNNLNFNFYGFRYLLMPKFVAALEKEMKGKVLKIIEKQRDPVFRKTGIKSLTSNENEMLETLSEQENYLNMNFLFYDAPKGYDGSVFNILLYIEDILPSRLRALFKIKEEIDKIDMFKECMVPVFENKKKTGEKSLEFNFGVLRTFFPQISRNQTYNKYFLDITNKVFTNKPINYHFLIRFIVQKIKDDFIQPDNWFGAKNQKSKMSTLKGFMLLSYLKKLKILKDFKGVKRMDENKVGIMDASGELGGRIDSFFGEFADFFDSNAKKTVFLEGSLAQFLLNIQYQERKATPFRVKLKGLKLDEKQIKKLLPEIQNKLEEYNKNYYRELETIISGYSVAAGNGWKISNDEISYYFVLGMNLSYLFKSEHKEGKEVRENE